jgi:siroheme synthase
VILHDRLVSDEVLHWLAAMPSLSMSASNPAPHATPSRRIHALLLEHASKASAWCD